MERLHSLLAQKDEHLRAMLEIAKEQIDIAAKEGEMDVAALDAAVDRRAQLIGKVDALDAEIAPRLEGLGEAVERDDRCGQLLASIRQSLEAISRIDEHVRAILNDLLKEYGQQARKQNQTRQGVNAYMGMQNQVGSLYIDKKK